MKFLEWFATIITLIGAGLTSLHYDPYNVYLLNFGSLLWIFWSLVQKHYSIALVNAGMMIIYALGTLERMNIINLFERI